MCLSMALPEFTFYILLPLVAFMYAAVGHGGASGYLALMALFNFAPDTIKPTALILNILVSFIAFIHYRKAAPLPLNLFAALVIASIPMAFLGGKVSIDPKIYRLILAAFLCIPVVRLLGIFPLKEKDATTFKLPLALMIGAIIGFLSGLIGIGGGIILSPVLLMLGWSNLKTTSTLSALFITLNSIAGIAGAKTASLSLEPNMLIYIILALAGGTLGAYLGSKRFNTATLRTLLAIVLLMASVKLALI